jgi:hypothetical protein
MTTVKQPERIYIHMKHSVIADWAGFRQKEITTRPLDLTEIHSSNEKERQAPLKSPFLRTFLVLSTKIFTNNKIENDSSHTISSLNKVTPDFLDFVVCVTHVKSPIIDCRINNISIPFQHSIPPFHSSPLLSIKHNSTKPHQNQEPLLNVNNAL